MSPTEGLPTAIPLSVLFGNPDKRMPRLSPNGKYYAYLADATNGVTNVFLKPVCFPSSASVIDDEDTVEPQQLTQESHRPLRYFVWSKTVNQLRLFYIQDKNGDENFHLYATDFRVDDENHKVFDLHVKDLTPFENVTVMPDSIQTSKKFPDSVILALNQRDPRFFDAVRIHVPTGQVEIDVENPGDVAQWLTNDDFQVWGCVTANPKDGSETLRIRPSLENKDASTWRTIAVWPHGEIARVHAFTADGQGVYVETSLSHNSDGESSNTSRLVLLSTADGSELEVLAQDETCDVDSVSFNANTRVPEYVVFNYTKPRVQALDEHVKADLETLVNLCKGVFSHVSASDDNLVWLYADVPTDASLKYYIYDRRTKHQALLFDSRPELSKYTLVTMNPHVIKTSDNEDLVVYMSLPHGLKPVNLPFVLNVHGGPWARDNWTYDPVHQLFTNRGYGCISVNFRGSTGLGKRWTNLGDKQWGATMQQDLTDAVQWASKQGYADKDKFAIYGGSYGGYAVLAGLAFTPELYACGIDIVGPSNAQTLLASIPPYWEPLRKMLLLRVGPVDTDEAFNRKVSPLFHADKIQKPLLIAQGANDPRVKQAESDQIARKLYENKHEVQYILYKDEGHGFARPANKLDFTSRVEAFLATHLGGKQLPPDETLTEGTSAVEIDVAAL